MRNSKHARQRDLNLTAGILRQGWARCVEGIWRRPEHTKKVTRDKDSQGGKRQTRHHLQVRSGIWMLFQVQSEGTWEFSHREWHDSILHLKKIMILSVENYTLAVFRIQPRWQNGLIWQSQLNYIIGLINLTLLNILHCFCLLIK